jgi:hypothetical protein
MAGAEMLNLYGVARKGELPLIFHDDRRARAGWNGSERPIPIIDVSGLGKMLQRISLRNDRGTGCMHPLVSVGMIPVPMGVYDVFQPVTGRSY